MITVDLHGVKHKDVEDAVVNACAMHETPFIIITGKSESMKMLVALAAKSMGLFVRDTIDNPGRVIIHESR